MRPPRLPIRRIALCIVLGALTSWAVAWGLAFGAWTGWFRDPRWPTASGEFSFSTRGPHVYTRSGWRTRCHTMQAWWVTRLDRDDDYHSLWAQARLATWTGREWQPPQGAEMPFFPHGSPGLPPPKHCDDIFSEFDRAGLAGLLDDSTSIIIECYGTGWPSPCLWRALVEVDGSSTKTPRWTWNIDGLQAESSWNGILEPLQLPLRPIWPGLLVNTAFYAALWSLPLSALPLLKHRRRKRRGHCPRCNYDLKGALAQGCPECGWNRSASVPNN